MIDGKRRWANPLWFFFHGFSEKINENYYNNNYMTCFKFFSLLCKNIPCPLCKAEAMQKINKTNPHIELNNKKKLKLYWFNFHNEVNRRLRKKIYNIEYLELYKKINMRKCIVLVDKTFFAKYYSFKVFNGWLRNSFKSTWVKFIRNHYKLLGIKN